MAVIDAAGAMDVSAHCMDVVGAKIIRMSVGQGVLGFGGVAFMTVLAVLTVLESPLPSSCFSYKIQDKETAMTVLIVFAVLAVPVMTATPLKLNPPFPTSRDDWFSRLRGPD